MPDRWRLGTPPPGADDDGQRYSHTERHAGRNAALRQRIGALLRTITSLSFDTEVDGAPVFWLPRFGPDSTWGWRPEALAADIADMVEPVSAADLAERDGLDEERTREAVRKATAAALADERDWSTQDVARAAIEAYVIGEVIDR